MIGEQTFDALGERFTLFLGNSAQCGIEEQYDRGFFAVVSDAMPDVDAATAMAVAQSMTTGETLPAPIAERAAAAMRGMRMSVLRDLAWHGLLRNHPMVTLRQVSDIIDDIGHEAFGEIIGKAIQAAQGKAKEASQDDKPGKPRPVAKSRKPRVTSKQKKTGRA